MSKRYILFVFLLLFINFLFAESIIITANYIENIRPNCVVIHSLDGVQLAFEKVTKKHYKKGLEISFDSKENEKLIISCLKFSDKNYSKRNGLYSPVEWIFSYVGKWNGATLDYHIPNVSLVANDGSFSDEILQDHTFIRVEKNSDGLNTLIEEGGGFYFKFSEEYRSIKINTQMDKISEMRIYAKEHTAPIILNIDITDNMINIPVFEDLTIDYIDVCIEKNEMTIIPRQKSTTS